MRKSQGKACRQNLSQMRNCLTSRSLSDTAILGSCPKWIRFTEYWIGLLTQFRQFIRVFVSTELQKCIVTHPCIDSPYSTILKHSLTDTDSFQ